MGIGGAILPYLLLAERVGEQGLAKHRQPLWRGIHLHVETHAGHGVVVEAGQALQLAVGAYAPCCRLQGLAVVVEAHGAGNEARLLRLKRLLGHQRGGHDRIFHEGEIAVAVLGGDHAADAGHLVGHSLVVAEVTVELVAKLLGVELGVGDAAITVLVVSRRCFLHGEVHHLRAAYVGETVISRQGLHQRAGGS